MEGEPGLDRVRCALLSESPRASWAGGQAHQGVCVVGTRGLFA